MAFTSLVFNARQRPPRDFRVSHIIPELKKRDSLSVQNVNYFFKRTLRLFLPSDAHVQQLGLGNVVDEGETDAVNVQRDFLLYDFQIAG